MQQAVLTPKTIWNPDTSEAGSRLDFSLVIACYCEEPHLKRNVLELARYFLATRLRFEFIFVEDASPDGTRREIEGLEPMLREKKIPYQILYHFANQGRGATVTDGIMLARGRAVGFIDIDLEHVMDSFLPCILDVLDDSSDAVMTARVYQKSMLNMVRIVTSIAYKNLVKRVLDLPVTDTESGLKVFNREKIIPVLAQVHDKFWFWDTEICYASARAGLKVTEHPIVFVKDQGKKSTVRLLRDSMRQLKCLTALWLRHRKSKRAVSAATNQTVVDNHQA